MRKVLVQRMLPLSMEWKKRAPFMRKITYHFEGKFILDDSIEGEQEFMKMLYDRFGPGSYQLLAWKKYAIRLRDSETRKPITKEKVFPLFHIATVIIENNGRGRFIQNKMKRMFKSWDRPYESPFERKEHA